MSSKNNADENNKTIQEEIYQLEQDVEWFEQEDFDIDRALERFKLASARAKTIETRLTQLTNEIEILSQRFDEK